MAICENPKSLSNLEVQELNQHHLVNFPGEIQRSTSTSTSTMHVGSNNNSIRLQTAQALVSRPENQETGMYTQVIFDSCSPRCYITSKTREQLNLPTVGKETLGYVFRDFCLRQGIKFIIFYVNQGIDLSIFVLNRINVLSRVGKSAIFVLNRVRV